MAQQQIALQQVRSGKQRDLPDALEKGQLGFSTDVGRVFIGLPATSDPSSIVAGRNWTNAPNSGKENVEIITEFTPWEVINDLVNKPVVITVQGNTTTSNTIRSKSRAFINYVAYDNGSVLETGSVQIVVVGSRALIAQQNNTNQDDGVFDITFLEPTYDSTTKRMTMPVQNTSTNTFTIEFTISGWDE